MLVAAALLLTGPGSLALIARELGKAPEGYEDDRGFHTVHEDKGDRIDRAKTATSTTANTHRSRIRHVFL